MSSKLHVACQIEGIGIDIDHDAGMQWLRKAYALGSTQAAFELATVLYSSGEADSEAFQLFSEAAKQGHTGALFMAADCLLDGVGTPQDAAQAVPLLRASAERGHRYARQRLRELLDQDATQNAN